MSFHQAEIQKRLTGLTESEAPFVLATVTRTRHATSAKAGAKAIVEPDGSIVGWLGGGCVQRALREAAALCLTEGKARLIRVKPDPQSPGGNEDDPVLSYKSSCPSGGSVEIFLEPVLPRAQLVVCGGSPIAVAIAELAHWLGFALVVAALPDDLANFDQAQHESSDHRIEGFDLGGLPAARERHLVVATQGKADKKALAAILGVEATSRAFVGSRAKAAALKAELEREGADPQALASLQSPAGLDIGGIGPQEIALSVLADIVRQRRAVAPSTRDLAAAAL